MSKLTTASPVSNEEQPLDERRFVDRFPCDLKSACKPIEHPRTGNPWPATIKDLSASGVRLSMFRRFEPGTLLTVQMPGSSNSPLLLLARVVRVSTKSRGRWVHGCVLETQLDAEELEALVSYRCTAWIRDPDAASRETKLEINLDDFAKKEQLRECSLDLIPHPAPFDETGAPGSELDDASFHEESEALSQEPSSVSMKSSPIVLQE